RAPALGEAGQVVVRRDDGLAALDAVVEDHAVAVAAVVVLLDDRPSGGRANRGAAADAEVGSVMQLVDLRDRVPAHAVRRGDRTIHRARERAAAVATSALAAVLAVLAGQRRQSGVQPG